MQKSQDWRQAIGCSGKNEGNRTLCMAKSPRMLRDGVSSGLPNEEGPDVGGLSRLMDGGGE
jgi:hypothetical protein